jgi:hypothetical protein
MKVRVPTKAAESHSARTGATAPRHAHPSALIGDGQSGVLVDVVGYGLPIVADQPRAAPSHDHRHHRVPGREGSCASNADGCFRSRARAFRYGERNEGHRDRNDLRSSMSGPARCRIARHPGLCRPCARAGRRVNAPQEARVARNSPPACRGFPRRFPRHHFGGGDENCSRVGTTAVTVRAGPPNRVGGNPKIAHRPIPKPSAQQAAPLVDLTIPGGHQPAQRPWTNRRAAPAHGPPQPGSQRSPDRPRGPPHALRGS